MKKLFSLFILSTFLLTACGGGIEVADKVVMSEHPELEGVIGSWQAMVNAAEKEDCEAFLDYMRVASNSTVEDCPDAFEYMADGGPVVDWDRSEWNSTMGKVKIYKAESGSITSFILNEATDVWGADSKFWE